MRPIAAALGVAIVLSVYPTHATAPGGDGSIAFAYESPVPGEHLTQSDLYVVAADGTGLVQLTASSHRHEFGPDWNPNGTRIAFWRTRAPFGPGSIWIVDADGSDPVRLTAGIDARDPSWSPNGNRIAFTVFDGRGPDIVTIRASDGGAFRRITRWPSLEFEPAWSPDASTIAFTRGYGRGDVGDVWRVDLGTGHATQVTSSPSYDHQVAWSPDGSLLVFERVAPLSISRILTVAADGGTPTAHTSGHFDADPVFAPSASRIAFVSDRQGSFFPDLWTMAPDGSDRERVLDLPGASTGPSWQAIGT